MSGAYNLAQMNRNNLAQMNSNKLSIGYKKDILCADCYCYFYDIRKFDHYVLCWQLDVIWGRNKHNVSRNGFQVNVKIKPKFPFPFRLSYVLLKI